MNDLKKVDEHLKRKSRLIAQSYTDERAATIATKYPPVQLFKQRMKLCIAVTFPHMDPYTRYEIQTYMQCHTLIKRDVYIQPLRELYLGAGYVLKVVLPLCVIPESGLHWYFTYLTTTWTFCR